MMADASLVDFTRKHKGLWAKGLGRLYPVPVIRSKKYLLEVEDEWEFGLLLDLINHQFLRNTECFVFDRIHTDGETPIYKFQVQDALIAVVQSPSIDLPKSQQIEELLSRSLFKKNADKVSLKAELKERYAKFVRLLVNQKNCSSCQNLNLQSLYTQSVEQLLFKHFCSIEA